MEGYITDVAEFDKCLLGREIRGRDTNRGIDAPRGDTHVPDMKVRKCRGGHCEGWAVSRWKCKFGAFFTGADKGDRIELAGGIHKCWGRSKSISSWAEAK